MSAEVIGIIIACCLFSFLIVLIVLYCARLFYRRHMRRQKTSSSLPDEEREIEQRQPLMGNTYTPPEIPKTDKTKSSNKYSIDDSSSDKETRKKPLFPRGQRHNQLKQQQIQQLEELEQRYIDYFLKCDETKLRHLKKKRNDLLQRGVDLKKAYELVLKSLLESMLEYERSLLEVPEGGGTVSQVINYKEQYKIYGLLLSACIKIEGVDHGSPKDVKQKVSNKYSFINGGTEVDTSVNKALSMTWSMLTLLPPLLVTKPQCKYSEDILDTNRHTWDEDKSGPQQLYYYRPVLVYGNRLHVAVKGLVGNSL